MGTRSRSTWALNTSDGIILYDTQGVYDAEDVIVGGLKKLGLDPAKVKYVIISHAHGNEVGGAKLMQDRYGAHIVMGAGDWDMVDQSVNGFPNGKPKRDIVATDGMKITLGGRTVTLYLMPGHTPGTISGIFQVRDHGKPLTVAYSGGTEFNFVNDVPHFDTYLASERKFAAIAAAAGATIIMGNQSQFDSAVPKLRMLADRRPGEAHPLDVGAAAVARYFKSEDEVGVGAIHPGQIFLDHHHRDLGPALDQFRTPAGHAAIVEECGHLRPESDGLRQHGRDNTIRCPLQEVPDEGATDAEAHHHEFVDAQVIQQAELVIRV